MTNIIGATLKLFNFDVTEDFENNLNMEVICELKVIIKKCSLLVQSGTGLKNRIFLFVSRALTSQILLDQAHSKRCIYCFRVAIDFYSYEVIHINILYTSRRVHIYVSLA